MTVQRIELPPKLIPVFSGEADYRGAYGGRGSAKTRSFAKMSAVKALQFAAAGQDGLIVCAREFMNSLDESSLAEVKAAIASETWLAEHFDVGEKYVRTKDGRIEYDFIGLARHLDSIKSKAKIRLLWVDEAEPVSEAAWSKAVNTVREDGAEIWVTWNPERKNSDTHRRFRVDPPARSRIVELNWRDNPWFPDTLNRKRLDDLEKRPDSYEHVWEGDFVTVAEGAYYASALTSAKAKGHISRVEFDPLMTVRLFCDIGGTGARADAFAMWPCQFIGREIRTRDYYEAVGQPLATHLNWLRSKGYTPERAEFWLPHDGASNDKVFAVSYESALRDAGYTVTIVPNQGKGAAAARIEAARRIFPSVWFDEETTEAGRDALGWYHEKRDDKRGIGLGPDHDWSSHACFTADTKVLTRYGMCRIDSLPETGEVLTPCGWKRYIWPRITKRAAPLVEVRFVGGHTVRCTPDHLFLTESGWKSAESLETGSLIQSSLTPSRSILMAASTAFGPAKAIIRAAGRSCTAMFGRMRSALFPRAATFTTGIAIRQTIPWPILSAWTHVSTCRTLGRRGALIGTSISRSTLATRPQSGIVLRLGGSGTSATQSGQRAGQSGSASRETASIAAKSSPASSERTGISKSIAALIARLRLIANAARRMNAPLRIERVRRLRQTADVWDITVPETHCFSLANGAVVHNSDAFGTMAVAYREPIEAQEARPFAMVGQRPGGWMAA